MPHLENQTNCVKAKRVLINVMFKPEKGSLGEEHNLYSASVAGPPSSNADSGLTLRKMRIQIVDDEVYLIFSIWHVLIILYFSISFKDKTL